MTTAAFQKVQKSVDVSDFRAAMASHLAKAKNKPLVVSARRGGDSFVVLSVDTYNKLVETWENEQDSKELARLVKLQKGKKWVELKR
jgi:PHD/YefM family antitoxin component YafN of YafNO toxin-antitoxin module